MKYILLLSLVISAPCWAKKTVVDFNQILNEEVQYEIKKDAERFKKDGSRAPASVQESEMEPVIEDVPKIDKNVRQIGPNKW